jgi:hypothetical protein
MCKKTESPVVKPIVAGNVRLSFVQRMRGRRYGEVRKVANAGVRKFLAWKFGLPATPGLRNNRTDEHSNIQLFAEGDE